VTGRFAVAIAAGSTVACAGAVSSAGARVHVSASARGACVSFRPVRARNGHSVFLDPGHGGIDSGATGVTAAERPVVEKQLTLRPGSVVLLHENLRQTQFALPAVLRGLRAAGLQSVSIPQLLALDPSTLEQLRAGIHGCPGAHP
jgi:hypothetical protein